MSSSIRKTVVPLLGSTKQENRQKTFFFFTIQLIVAKNKENKIRHSNYLWTELSLWTNVQFVEIFIFGCFFFLWLNRIIAVVILVGNVGFIDALEVWRLNLAERESIKSNDINNDYISSCEIVFFFSLSVQMYSLVVFSYFSIESWFDWYEERIFITMRSSSTFPQIQHSFPKITAKA